MKDALENILIAYGMGWDLEGVMKAGYDVLYKEELPVEQDFPNLEGHYVIG